MTFTPHGPPGQWYIQNGSMTLINQNIYTNLPKSLDMLANNISGVGAIDAAGTSNLALRAGGSSVIISTAGLGINNPPTIGLGAWYPAITIESTTSATALQLSRKSDSLSTGQSAGVISAFAGSTAQTEIGRIQFVISGTAENSGDITFSTTSGGVIATPVAILNNGNVGIGTSTPTTTTHVSGNLTVDGYVRIGTQAVTPAAGYLILKDPTTTRSTLYFDTVADGITGGAALGDMRFTINGANRLFITNTSNIILGDTAALATNATNGFIYIPTMAGAPTGIPTGYTGKTAMVYNTTSNYLHIYNGAWRSGAFV